MIKNRLDVLGLGKDVSAREIYNSLIHKINYDNDLLAKGLEINVMDIKDCFSHCERALKAAKEVSGSPKGFFLKKKKRLNYCEISRHKKLSVHWDIKILTKCWQKKIFLKFSARFVFGGPAMAQ